MIDWPDTPERRVVLWWRAWRTAWCDVGVHVQRDAHRAFIAWSRGLRLRGP